MLCNRCGQDRLVDSIGRALASFVCPECRMDDAVWSFKEKLEVRDNEENTDN